MPANFHSSPKSDVGGDAPAAERGSCTGAIPGAARPVGLGTMIFLFVGSGCAALIYEIVWFQGLQLVIGSSAISLGVLLGTFMGGMCLGSLLLARVARASAHPLRVYAILELGIAVLGLLELAVMPLAGRFYLASGGEGQFGLILRSLVAAVCLLPPTMLMGATLPAVARWVQLTPAGVSRLGLFYTANLAGAVLGCLLAGFYLLRVYDMLTATLVAAGINILVAAAAWQVAARTPFRVVPTESTDHNAPPATSRVLPYVAIALSGFCALGAEVIWTRLLSLMMGPTVYTFAIILAVFLVGLGIGGGLGSAWARVVERPALSLAWCQALAIAGIAWASWMIARSLPYWPINPALSKSVWHNFQLDLVRVFWAIFPATLLWGASFPLAVAAVSTRKADPARVVGRVYAANTVGAIIGSLLFSLCLVRGLGTQRSQQLMIAVSGFSALLILVPATFFRGRNLDGAESATSFRARWPGLLALLAVIAAGVLVIRTLPAVPRALIAHGRLLPTRGGEETIIYSGEGLSSSVAVSQLSDGIRNFHVSGKIEASTELTDMRMQRMLGHIPGLFHPDPKSLLIVGCGAGVTAGSFVLYPGIEKIVICEIERLIPQVVANYFAKENYGVLKDPRVRVVYDDARHYILTTSEKFDIITSDPIHPWVKGAATLYTREYFDLVRRHLNPGGLVTQWVPLYQSDLAVVKSELATFFDVFKTGSVWGNDSNGEGYDVVLLGSAAGAPIDLDIIKARWQTNERLNQSLKDSGFPSVFSLLTTYAAQAHDLEPWLQDAQINRDRNLRLQYLAGLGLDLYDGDRIYSEITQNRRFPETLFAGSDQHLEMVRLIIARPRK